jgi:hypothetical protein
MQEDSGEDSKVRLQATGDYEVGYGRPPKSTRFKKGQSGNPKGRQKGTKNIATYVEIALQQRVLVREGGKDKRRTKADVIARRAVVKAMTGDLKPLLDLTKMSHSDQAPKDGGGPHGALLVEIPADNSLDAVAERVRKNQDELQARVKKHVKY